MTGRHLCSQISNRQIPQKSDDNSVSYNLTFASTQFPNNMVLQLKVWLIHGPAQPKQLHAASLLVTQQASLPLQDVF